MNFLISLKKVQVNSLEHLSALINSFRFVVFCHQREPVNGGKIRVLALRLGSPASCCQQCAARDTQAAPPLVGRSLGDHLSLIFVACLRGEPADLYGDIFHPNMYSIRPTHLTST